MTGQKTQRVIINCAMSVDGKLALPSRQQTRISSDEDMARVFRLRNSADAIVVGIGTVLNDDPKLTVKEKYVKNPRNPVRVVLDSALKTPARAQVVNGAARTIIAVSEKARRKPNKYARFAAQEHIELLPCGGDTVNLKTLLRELDRRGLNTIMVEGGGTVIWSFLSQGLFDEVRVYVGSLVIGGETAPTMAGGSGAQSLETCVPLRLVKTTRVGDGVLLTYVKK